MINRLKIQEYLAGKACKSFTVDEQVKYLKRLGWAYNDIERSYKQYLCQRYYMPLTIKIINDILAIFISPILLFYYFIKGFFSSKKMKIQCIGDLKGFTEIIPRSLIDEYDINNDLWFSGALLKYKDIKYIYSIFVKYPFSPLFIFKIILKVSRYSYMIYTYETQVFVVHNEYSFTSSVLTDYCNKNGVLHINVMHGEKGYIIRDSYFHYDKCFVWDQFYIDLFISLYAEPTQFIIEVPESMNIDINSYKNPIYYADYKYYLSKCTPEKLFKIVQSMEFAKREGKIVKYRLHPRYSDIATVEKIVGKENIEYPNRTTIMESISNCGCAVACKSTVLHQAYRIGVPVMLDDVAEKDEFDKLKSFKNILINKGLPLLSSKQ